MKEHELNSAASEAAKIEGMANAEKGAPDGWIEQAVEKIHWIALRFPFVTADDVWATGLDHPREPRAVGPCFKKAQSLGMIEPTEIFVMTSQIKSHRAPMRVWRSLISGSRDDFSERSLYSRAFIESLPSKKELAVALEEMRTLAVEKIDRVPTYKPSPEFVKLGKWVADKVAEK